MTARPKLVETLRWIAVLPASILTTVALIALTRVVTPRRMAQLPGTPIAPPTIVERYVLPLAFLTAMGLAFVIVGAKTAPRHRPLTAIVLAVLWILYAFQLFVFVHLGRGRPHYLFFFVAVLTALAGVVYIRRSERRISQ
ncbi:MAG: hypothetical protein SH850_25600 [Planctomycetaceae bacterium]|nr:hypothetical protein [Planctomycetaceae bacterium]